MGSLDPSSRVARADDASRAGKGGDVFDKGWFANPIVSILYLAFLVLMIASCWKVYVKAGKPGWAAIVPIYNVIVLLEIVGKPLWWVLLMFVPLVNVIVAVIIYVRLSRKFGYDIGFAIGLLLLSFIFWPILGFGSAQYHPEAA